MLRRALLLLFVVDVACTIDVQVHGIPEAIDLNPHLPGGLLGGDQQSSGSVASTPDARDDAATQEADAVVEEEEEVDMRAIYCICLPDCTIIIDGVLSDAACEQ